MLTAAERACQLFGPSQRKTKLNETKLPNYRLASSKAWELPQRTRHVVKCISSASQLGRGEKGYGVTTLTHIGAGRRAAAAQTSCSTLYGAGACNLKCTFHQTRLGSKRKVNLKKKYICLSSFYMFIRRFSTHHLICQRETTTIATRAELRARQTFPIYPNYPNGASNNLAMLSKHIQASKQAGNLNIFYEYSSIANTQIRMRASLVSVPTGDFGIFSFWPKRFSVAFI